MSRTVEQLQHSHVFLGQNHERNERRVWLVIALTTTMMVVEIAAGSLFGSMALLADGWHMSTHAGAMLIAALAYWYARRRAHDGRFTFGTGKLGDLAAFASAIVLALIALLIAYESIVRLADPVAIDFRQAIIVAVVGLVVNIVSAWLLKDDHHHGHAHSHAHSHVHDHGSHHHHDGGHDHPGDHHHSSHHDHHGHHGAADNNLRAAYLHVMADALTSVLAIAALAVGAAYGWIWLDPVMGIVGGLVIARWSWGLILSTSAVLLDVVPEQGGVAKEIRERIETPQDRITDLHVWQVGPGHHAAIVAVATPSPQSPSFYKEKLQDLSELSHVTVEVTQAAA